MRNRRSMKETVALLWLFKTVVHTQEQMNYAIPVQLCVSQLSSQMQAVKSAACLLVRFRRDKGAAGSGMVAPDNSGSHLFNSGLQGGKG